ncbi:hypothetical protein BW23_2893 [Burkholderia ubonensis MSMB22]|nr:hypothetical protein BW23_2893 [Burkholderia ubonensis MSMB22]
MTYEHEVVHFIQAMTSAYLQSHSFELTRLGESILKGHAQLRTLPPGSTLFSVSARRLSHRNDEGLSCRDLLESTAVVESFKLAAPDPSLVRYLGFRDDYFPGDSSSPYRRGFDWLAERIGQHFAYELLAPICFAAFAGDDPPGNFSIIVEDCLLSGDLPALCKLPMSDLFRSFGMTSGGHFLHHIHRYPDKGGPPILLPCAKAAVEALGAERLIEFAARPASIQDVPGTEFLKPPVVAFSAGLGQPLTCKPYGLAKTDRRFGKCVVELCAMLGAAERLTILRNNGDLYQFCPHSHSCPHFASALCFRWFAPPSLEQEHENCGFIKLFVELTGAVPNDVWNTHASPQ